LFVLAAPAIILYSQGFRFNFETKKIVQTGGFYFKVSPTSAQIHLDGKLTKKSDFFFGSVFWQNLLPKKYKVRIEKDGYQPWQKTLEVKKRLVTEAKNIILFPEKINFQILSREVEKFWVLPDQKRILLKKEVVLQEKTGINNWRLVIYDIQRNIQSLFLEEPALSKKERTDILSIDFSSDSKKILLTARVGESIQNFVAVLNSEPQTPLSLSFLGENIENIAFNPADSSKLLFITETNPSISLPKQTENEQGLYEADLATKKFL